MRKTIVLKALAMVAILSLLASVIAGAAFVTSQSVAKTVVDNPGSQAQSAEPDIKEAAAAEGHPVALSKHLEELAKAIPGNGGEPGDNPNGAADEKFLAEAYPNTDIPASSLDAARAAYNAVKSGGFPRGQGQKGAWTSIGPSYALYPFTELRNSTSYVPNEYAASGRTTSLAIDPNCSASSCRLWIGAAGGGVWRTDRALAGTPNWTYVSGSFGINAIGSISMDPNDASGNTLYVGTGEANASGDSAAGVGIYKTTDGGNTWTGPLGQGAFNHRAVGTIAVKPGDPNTIYAGTTRGVLGVSSVTGGSVSLIPGAPMWGLYKSTDGGATWTLVHDGAADLTGCSDQLSVANNVTPCSPRGVRRVVVDPVDANTIYAGSYARGVWRSNDGGATWTQIKASLAANVNTMRPEIAVTVLPNGATRMYVGEGGSGSPSSRLFRSDDVRGGVPVFTNLTSSSLANTGYGSYNYCSGQCWYDNFVYTPKGSPDVVYLGGSYAYGETGSVSNGRGVVLSTDAGVSFTDMTMDATDSLHPNGIHPDQHFLVTNPSNPYQFFEGGDGGVVRSSGAFADVSAWCAPRGLSGNALARCQQLLSRVPTQIASVNKGLSTLQFQSLSVNPTNAADLQGGTQDNGTWESYTSPVKWLNTMIGDGGQSGFDVSNPAFRFHTFYNATPDVNFSNGDMADWNWIADPIYGTEPQAFYVPIISDPVVSASMFAGTGHVWRTKTAGMGTMTLDELRQHCNEWTGDYAVTCGDWQALGSAMLIDASLGNRAGGYVAAVERATSDTSTLWAATLTGRVFVSKNADAEPASAVSFARIDTAATPGRFVSGIYIDPANANHAWVSYSGFNASTPSTPGHVFDVVFDPGTGTATWTDISYNLGDLPLNDVVRDDVNGTLYVASDFNVMSLAAGANTWTLAAPGMPMGEVAHLSIVPAARKLYAATHGLSAWSLTLP